MDTSDLMAMLEDIKTKENHLDEMVDNWNNGDPCTASCSDPSDQYVLKNEISDLKLKFKEAVDQFV